MSIVFFMLIYFMSRIYCMAEQFVRFGTMVAKEQEKWAEDDVE